jgi:hypothetical protein
MGPDAGEPAADWGRGDPVAVSLGNQEPYRLEAAAACVLEMGSARSAQAPALLSQSTAKRFLLALSRDGNVTHACRAAGVERGSVYRQRQRCPKFRTVWDETVAGAYHHLEMALVGAAATVADDSAGENKAAFGGMSAALGVQLLRLYRTKVMQTDGGSEDELPPIEAVRDEVLARLDAIRRHRARENGGEDSNDVEAGHGE